MAISKLFSFVFESVFRLDTAKKIKAKPLKNINHILFPLVIPLITALLVMQQVHTRAAKRTNAVYLVSAFRIHYFTTTIFNDLAVLLKVSRYIYTPGFKFAAFMYTE